MSAIDLLLVRHGNTFGPGDAVVWVGKGQDLPLVESGREQARALANTLAAANWSPDSAISGELVRQREHLSIATGGTPEPRVATELDEVDYGAWGGLSTEEIVERFGAGDVEAWNVRSEVPAGAGWPETADDLRARVRRFAERVASGELGGRVLACTSNGLLRWFLDLEPGALARSVEAGTFKVGTGKTCRLRYEQGSWSVLHWNRSPEDALD